VDRKRFLQAMALVPAAGIVFQLRHLNLVLEPAGSSEKMPALFLGHGSPMNAIEENEFSKGWQAVGKALPKAAAVLCISAHWETRGTYVTAMEQPRTIHDFGGFPPELFAVRYNAPGSPEIAGETKSAVISADVGLDMQWGLDHGCWSVVKHLYPKADIPVLQLSLDYTKGPQYHYELAGELNALRHKGILIVGSGNIVHNLSMINWQQPSVGYDWAIEANEKVKELITHSRHQELIHYSSQGKAFQLAVPTPEHYLPLLYILGLKDGDEKVTFFNDKAIMGSISMTSLKIS
jgi:4,5-DOPA dioxygenase extradiol